MEGLSRLKSKVFTSQGESVQNVGDELHWCQGFDF